VVGCSQVGGYLRVLLHGRRQRQMEDMEYYLAIRCGIRLLDI
jgi:hypothetical protein